MGDEPVLADLDPVDEAALDHVPAEQPLREAEGRIPPSAGSSRRGSRPRSQNHSSGTAKATPISRPSSRCDVFPEVDAFELASVIP